MMMEGIPFRMTRASLLKQKMKTQGRHFHSLRYYKNRHTHTKKKSASTTYLQQLLDNTRLSFSFLCTKGSHIPVIWSCLSCEWNELECPCAAAVQAALSSTIMEPLLCIFGAQDWSLPQCCSQLSKPQSCKCKPRLLRQNIVAQEQSNCLWSPRNRIIPKLNHFQALTEMMKMRRSELFKVNRSTIWS